MAERPGRCFALYRGSPASGATVANGGENLLVANSRNPQNSNDFSGNPGVARWWASPDESTHLYVAHPVGTVVGDNNQPVPAGVTLFAPDTPLAGVGFWGVPATAGNLDVQYDKLLRYVYQKVTSTPAPQVWSVYDMRVWVASEGLWDNGCYDNIYAYTPPINCTMNCEVPQDPGAAVSPDYKVEINWYLSYIPANGFEWEIRTSGLPGSGPSGLYRDGTSFSYSYGSYIFIANTMCAPEVENFLYVRTNCGGIYSNWAESQFFGAAP